MVHVVVVVFCFGAKLYHFHTSPSFSLELIPTEYRTVEIRLSLFMSTVIDFNDLCICLVCYECSSYYYWVITLKGKDY